MTARVCQVCDMDGRPATPATIDGRTRYGPWAYMCDDCHARHGVGLGLGHGQRLTASAAAPVGAVVEGFPPGHTTPAGGQLPPGGDAEGTAPTGAAVDTSGGAR